MITLHEILIKHIPTELYDPSLDKYYLSAMKEACEQIVDLCAENTKKSWLSGSGINEIQAILETKKQIV